MKDRILKENDPLTNLLNRELMDVPSSEFSDKLLHSSIASYKVSYRIKYLKQERLGKIIMLVLIFFNLMMLHILNPLKLSTIVSFFFLATAVSIGLLCLWILLKSAHKTTNKIELKLHSQNN